MSNTYQWIKSLKAEGMVYNPLGSGRFPPIAPEDIAAVAVKTLIDAEPADKILELTRSGDVLRRRHHAVRWGETAVAELDDSPVETVVARAVALVEV